MVEVGRLLDRRRTKHWCSRRHRRLESGPELFDASGSECWLLAIGGEGGHLLCSVLAHFLIEIEGFKAGRGSTPELGLTSNGVKLRRLEGRRDPVGCEWVC